MATFRKILVPIDFSPHSGEALRVAAEMAKMYDASITVTSVFQPAIYPLPEGAILPSPIAHTDALARTRELLERAVEQATTASGMPVEAKLLQGVPFVEIVGLARSGGFDLIVMGTHGRTGIGHALLGSVAEKVVRKAPCAVLTLRMGHKFTHP